MDPRYSLAWLPILDISFEAGRLGDIAYLPYRLVQSLFATLGIDFHQPLVISTIGAGLLLFTMGTLAWFSTRYRGGFMITNLSAVVEM